ncbi:MAG: phenylalanine-4-hydroxylase [Thermoproteota archaeon]|jgi:phenylalanine-4-hydroxylase
MKLSVLFIFYLSLQLSYAEICNNQLTATQKILNDNLDKNLTLTSSSGVQIEGKFSNLHLGANKEPIYFNFDGATNIRYKNEILPGQGIEQHAHGFSSPIGELVNSSKALEDLSKVELKELGIEVNKTASLKYKSGVSVVGDVTGITKKDGKNIIITFENATVKNPQGETLFAPDWGTYDMTVLDHFKLDNLSK